jgi:hypothetical protein
MASSQTLLPTVQPREGDAPPAWLVREMHVGVIALCRQALIDKPRTPEEELESAKAFAEVIWPGRRWDEALDRNRIHAAFSLLAEGHRCDGLHRTGRFPIPRDLADAMPRRKGEEESPKPPPDPAKVAAARARFRLIVKPKPPEMTPMARANLVRKRFGEKPFESQDEYERYVLEQRRITEEGGKIGDGP